MSSAGKSLNASDVTVLPHTAYKTGGIGIYVYSDITSSGYNYIYRGLDDTGSLFLPTHSINYRAISNLLYNQQVYSQSYLKPTAEMTAEELFDVENNNGDYTSKQSYDNYLQSTAASGTLDTDARYFYSSSYSGSTQLTTGKFLSLIHI